MLTLYHLQTLFSYLKQTTLAKLCKHVEKTSSSAVVMCEYIEESIVAKGEIACDKQFLLLPQCFLKVVWRSILSHFLSNDIILTHKPRRTFSIKCANLETTSHEISNSVTGIGTIWGRPCHKKSLHQKKKLHFNHSESSPITNKNISSLK